MINKLNINWY